MMAPGSAVPEQARCRRSRTVVFLLASAGLMLASFVAADVAAQRAGVAPAIVLKPARVFDGANLQDGWIVVVRGERIEAAGPASAVTVPPDAESVAHARDDADAGPHRRPFARPAPPLRRDTLGRSGLCASRSRSAWRAPRSMPPPPWLRASRRRAISAPKAPATPMSACDRRSTKASFPGPRLLVAGPALIATGSYAPKGFAPEFSIPQGAEEADGVDGLSKATRDQIGHGIDVVKVYADYRWGPRGEARPTFTENELALIVGDRQEQRPAGGRACLDRRGHAARDDGRRRDHRAWRRWQRRRLPADGREGRRAAARRLPPVTPRSSTPVEEGHRPGAGAHQAQARQLQGGARRRRAHRLRRRRRRVRARRQRARDRVDGGLRHEAARRRPLGHGRERAPSSISRRSAVSRPA